MTMTVEPIEVVLDYRITLPTEQMKRLYHDINVTFRVLDVDFAGNRDRYDIPALYALYDALYEAGAAS